MKKARLADLSILVVDDEPMLCEVLSDLFGSEGATVEMAFGGVEALEILKTKKFHILFSDVRMPQGDGPFLVKSLTEQQRSEMQVYFCSGYNDLSEEQLKNLGIVELFSKPFDFDGIVDRIIATYKR